MLQMMKIYNEGIIACSQSSIAHYTLSSSHHEEHFCWYMRYLENGFQFFFFFLLLYYIWFGMV